MLELPDRLPILKAGKQYPGSGGVCAEQAVNWLVSGRLDLGDETDHPECVQPVLNALSIKVNDLLPDSRRGEMWPLILAQPGTARPDMEPVLSVRLAAWCASQVLHLVNPRGRDAAKKAMETALAWCDNPCKATAANAAAAYAAANAAAAAYAANAAAYAAAYAYAYANAYAAALLELLARCQTEHARLTGHTTNPPDLTRIERLVTLVGSR